jgi:hypothetical protein
MCPIRIESKRALPPPTFPRASRRRRVEDDREELVIGGESPDPITVVGKAGDLPAVEHEEGCVARRRGEAQDQESPAPHIR